MTLTVGRRGRETQRGLRQAWARPGLTSAWKGMREEVGVGGWMGGIIQRGC